MSSAVRPVSGVVHGRPGERGAAASSQRLRLRLVLLSVGLAAVGMLGAALGSDGIESQSLPLFSFFFWLLVLAVRAAYGDRLGDVTAGNERWCFQSREER